MKPKRREKLIRYVEEDELGKLKRYIRKHHINVNSVRLGGDDTLLHLACSRGYEAVVRLLMREGGEPSLVNEKGELPLHVACNYALSWNSHAYTDLVLPLVKAYPGGLDVPTKRGVTARQLLQSLQSKLRIILDESDSSNSSSCSTTEEKRSHSSGSECSERDWNEKLAFEFQEECSEHLGPFDKDYEQEYTAETWDEWAERIMREHRKKRYAAFPATHRDAKTSTRGQGTSTSKGTKGISDERKRQFEKTLREEHSRQKRLTEQFNREENLLKQRLAYEQKCKTFFSDTTTTGLKFRDVPWPLADDKDVDSLKQLLFEDLNSRSTDYRRYVKEQQMRWHPDKFMQKFSSRLVETDRDKIMKRVTQISQCLNSIMDSHDQDKT